MPQDPTVVGMPEIVRRDFTQEALTSTRQLVKLLQ